MEYQIEPWTWTFVGDTGVEVHYEGADPQTVRVDEQGAVVLPTVTPQEAPVSLWTMRDGNAPVTRDGQPFDLDDEAKWPGGFELVDGRWFPLPQVVR